MWKVVYMAQNKEIAAVVEELLSTEGITVNLRPVSKSQEGNSGYYEILVPEAEVNEAHNVIIEKGY